MSEYEAAAAIVVVTAFGFFALWVVGGERERAERFEARHARLQHILANLTSRTGGQEPTRRDADDPLRDRFVFCEQTTDHGHAPDCPWKAAAAETVGEG